MNQMNDDVSMKVPSMFMLILGIGLIVSMPFAYDIWPAGFKWTHPGVNTPYEHMIIAIYLGLGICLIKGSKDPLKNSIIIDFTIVSSILHGAVMLYDAFAVDHEKTHLMADIPLMFILAAASYHLHPNRYLERGGKTIFNGGSF